MIDGFNEEWFTVNDDTRVLLSSRCGYPRKKMKFIAKVVVEALKNRSKNARLVQLFYDDKACSHCINIVSDSDKDNDNIAQEIENIINSIYDYGNDIVEMDIVKEGNKDSDHYDHMAYLSNEFFKK